MSRNTLNILAAITGNQDLLPDEPVVTETTVEDQIILESDIELAEFNNEAEAVSDEMDYVTEQDEQLEEVVEELEEVVEGMEMLLKQPQLNQAALITLYNRGSRLQKRVTGQSYDKVDGNESFDDTSLRNQMVTGQEGFMETLKKAGNVVAEYVKRIFYILYDFVMGFFDRTKSLESANKAVAKELYLGKEFKDKIQLGGWNRFFIDGKLNATDKVFNDLIGFIEQMGAYIEKMKNPDQAAPSVETLSADIGKGMALLSSKMPDGSKGSITYSALAPFVKPKPFNAEGGVFIHISLPKSSPADTKELIDSLKKSSFDYMGHTDIQNSLTGEWLAKLTGEAPAMLTPQEAKTITQNIVNDIKRLTKLKEEVAKRKSSVDEIVNRLPKLGEKDVTGAEQQKLLIELIKQQIAMYSRFAKGFSQAQVAVSQAKLKCIRAHYK